MYPLSLLRLDDIGDDIHKDTLVISSLIEAGLKVCLAVVPAWLNQQSSLALRGIAQHYPTQVEFHQHGYSHVDHSGQEAYEFGPNRSYEEQLADISNGWDLLRMHLPGDKCIKVFTPPFGGHDKNTRRALEVLGFQVISTFDGEEIETRLPNIAPAIDAFRWNPMEEKTSSEINAEMQELKENEQMGFILHPRLMASSTIHSISSVIPKLLAHTRTSLFSELLAASVGLRAIPQ